jgi:hypothetical protein
MPYSRCSTETRMFPVATPRLCGLGVVIGEVVMRLQFVAESNDDRHRRPGREGPLGCIRQLQRLPSFIYTTASSLDIQQPSR